MAQVWKDKNGRILIASEDATIIGHDGRGDPVAANEDGIVPLGALPERLGDGQ
jgi:hypothetical protein